MHAYSHSQLDAFRKCPLKFKLKYLDGMKTGVESIELFLGNRVHEALETLYRDLLDGKLHHFNDLVDLYKDRWNAEWHSGVLTVRTGRMDYFDYGVECIRNYFRENYPFDQSRTMSIEEWVEFDLDSARRRRFRGKVDRVCSRPDGIYEIHDYKTGQKIPSESETADDRQLTLYQIAVQSMHQEVTEVELVWHYLSRGVTYRLRRTRPDLRQILQDTNRLVDKIESEREFPANVGKLCDWCEFREICPAWE